MVLILFFIVLNFFNANIYKDTRLRGIIKTNNKTWIDICFAHWASADRVFLKQSITYQQYLEIYKCKKVFLNFQYISNNFYLLPPWILNLTEIVLILFYSIRTKLNLTENDKVYFELLLIIIIVNVSFTNCLYKLEKQPCRQVLKMYDLRKTGRHRYFGI